VGSDMKMRNTLFLASAVRSGSTYIAEEVAYRLERDAGFQFFGLTRDSFSQLANGSTAADVLNIYGSLFLDRSGWATSKIHCSALSIITREARRDATVRKAFFGPMSRWIIVRRHDKVAQAVSLAMARKTGRWHVYTPPGPDDGNAQEVTFREIEVALRSVLMDREYLEAFSKNLARQRMLTFDYEDVVASGRLAAAAVIKLCGLKVKLKKDKKRQVAKLVRTERSAKAKLAEKFLIWLAENYHDTAASGRNRAAGQAAQGSATSTPSASPAT
jgi:Stf0 sulphotransferase